MFNISKTLLTVVLIAYLLCFGAAQLKPKPNQKSKKVQDNRSILTNLFLHEKEIIIQAQIINNKKQSLSLKKTSFILQEEYIEMYKNRMSFQIPLTINQNLYQDLVMKISTFVVINQKPKFLFAQNISMIKFFTKINQQGLELFLGADLYDKHLVSTPQILKSLDVYVFNSQRQIYEDSTQQNQLYKKYNSTHYYVKPLIKKVNQVDPEQYKKVYQFETDQIHKIKVNIKLKTQFTLLVINALLNTDMAKSVLGKDQEEKYQSMFGRAYIDQLNNLITLFIKKLWLQSSNLGIIFFQINFVFFFTFVLISSFIMFIYQVKMFKNISKYKGISMFSYILKLVYCGIVFLILTILKQIPQSNLDNKINVVFQILFCMWMISKVMKIQFTDQFPFIGLKKQPWYERYFHVEQKVIKKTLLCFLPLLLPYSFCPFLIQGKQFTIQLFLTRLMQFITLYRTLFFLIPQIIMNYQLKNTQGVSWKLIFWYFCYSMSDMFTLMICNNYLSILFYLKQEILIVFLWYQRSIYKNNRCELLQDVENQDNDQNRVDRANANQKNNQRITNKENDQDSNISDSQQNKERIEQIDDQGVKLQEKIQQVEMNKRDESHQKIQ